MRNPVAHRATRMIAEAAASVPWVVFDGGREQERHPVKDLLNRPDPNGAGDGFFETLYGHLVLSGNGWINPVSAGGRIAGLQLLRPDRMRVIEGPDGWPVAYEHQSGGKAAALCRQPGGGAGALAPEAVSSARRSCWLRAAGGGADGARSSTMRQ
jgi:HK97 family phage portal protein